MKIISIYGLAGCGKSTIAKEICKQREDTGRLVGDLYLKSRGDIPLGEYFSNDYYDWDLVTAQLRQPEGSSVSSPGFNFDTFQRDPIQNVVSTTIKPIMIVDALFPYPGADFHILVEVDDLIRRERNEESQKRRNLTTWMQYNRDHWDELSEQIEKYYTIVSPNYTLRGDTSMEESVNTILTEVF